MKINKGIPDHLVGCPAIVENMKISFHLVQPVIQQLSHRLIQLTDFAKNPNLAITTVGRPHSTLS